MVGRKGREVIGISLFFFSSIALHNAYHWSYGWDVMRHGRTTTVFIQSLRGKPDIAISNISEMIGSVMKKGKISKTAVKKKKRHAYADADAGFSFTPLEVSFTVAKLSKR